MPHNNVANIFENLIGKWRFKRTFSTGEEISGKAQFKRRDSFENCLTYREDGVHQISGQDSAFHQNYYYYLIDNKIAVHNFMDDPMQTLKFDDKNGSGGYMCGLDRYDATLTFKDNNHFTMQYVVKSDESKTQNKKNYTAITQFKRITP